MMNINRYSVNEVELLAVLGLTLSHAINDGNFAVMPGIEVIKFKRAHELLLIVHDVQVAIHAGNSTRIAQLVKKLEAI